MRLIKKWLDYKLLTINFEKTHYIPFSCTDRNPPSFHKIEIDSSRQRFVILPKQEIKYLGVIIDSHLRWNHHINHVKVKLQGILYKFKYFRNLFNYRQLKILYHSLVESHLRYGILGWGGVVESHLSPLENLQKRFLKVILFKEQRYSSDLLFREANVMDIRQLYYYNVSVRCQIQQHTLPIRYHTYRTRQRNEYKIPFMSKTIGQRSFVFLAPKLYNTIPEDIKTIPTIRAFKGKLKRFILENCRQKIHNFIDLKNN